ncbi:MULTISPECIES: peptide ABC transporter substrate-binding protein [unclassified Sedimentibacter]|uniref:peptide ABC transporter substrate-binding protein n=1 Tax=unclassified Sedimentibacter TaxID=2649220 RepID=UPI0027E0F598|nr:peptide ABC transporter substrate-binding protein [Sedimentibacter sp. MB35-C1]WMJ77203.1 peptide ABC transporter substrate-binding protein [Sedimentibacter sp. MB35-C1]
MKKIKIFLPFLCSILSLFITSCNNNYFKEVSSELNNTLLWNLTSSKLTTWDPHLSNSSVVADINRQLFEGLTVLGENGYELGVAKKISVSSNSEGIENTIYTFKLRKDARWSDGKNVTAYDFEYSLKRACEQDDNVSKLFEVYIKGADKYINGIGSKDDIRVKAIDEYTLEIELNEPVPYFLDILTMPQFLPVRKDIIENVIEGWETNPKTCISNGPFKLYSYEPDSHVLLSKNNYYYDKENVKLQFIKCLINTHGGNLDKMFNNNEVHIMEIYPNGIIEGDGVLYSRYIGTSYIVFNTKITPFNDLNLRKAFSYAIDREYYCNNFYLDSVQSYGIIPPNMKLSDDTTFEEKRKKADYLDNVDLEKAKQLLNITRTRNINAIQIVELTTGNENYGNIIKNMLENNLDIKVNLKVVEFEELMNIGNTGKFELITMSYTADFNDPMTFFLNFSNSSKDKNRWYNEYFENEIASTFITQDELRDQHLINAEKILIEKLPAIPIYHYRNCYLFNDKIIGNLKCDALGNLILKNCILNINN